MGAAIFTAMAIHLILAGLPIQSYRLNTFAYVTSRPS
jgi:hypothetical protein